MSSEQLPDFYVEQYILGEAPDHVVRRIESDPELRAKADALRTDSASILETYPPEFFVGRIVNRARERGIVTPESEDWPSKLRILMESSQWVRPALAAVVAAALLVPVLLTQLTPGAAVGGDSADVAAGSERIKGLDTAISIYRQNPDGGSQELEEGESASNGDRLQVAYRAADAKHGVIFSVDGRGIVTLHHPRTVFDDTGLVRSGEVALPYAYVLDDSPRYEKFYFLSSQDPINVQKVLEKAERLARSDPDRVDPSMFSDSADEVSVFTIQKVEGDQ